MMSVHEPREPKTLRRPETMEETLRGIQVREKIRWDGRHARDPQPVGFVYSGLKRSPPSPSRMTALRKEKKRSEYSPGSTGLILC